MVSRRDISPLSRFGTTLGRPRGKQRLESLLGHPTPALAVHAVPANELYVLCQEVGLTEAAELVGLMTAQQVQGCLDFEIWDGARPVPERAGPWIDVLLESGPESVARVIDGMDAELTALLIGSASRIYDLSEDELPDVEEPPFFYSPDRLFCVKLLPVRVITPDDDEALGDADAGEDDQTRRMDRLLTDLYKASPQLARHVLRTARSEVGSSLEEECLRFRTARLEDYGFVPVHEARNVYQPLALEALRSQTATLPPSVPLPVPGAWGARVYSVGFLGQVLEIVADGADAERIETGLLLLLNRVLSADKVDPSDEQAIERVLARTAGVLGIALEAATRGDREAARTLLDQTTLLDLHRAGVGVLGKVSALATALGQNAMHADEPYASLVRAASSRPLPLFPGALDDPQGEEPRPFRNLVDVARATEALARLALQLRYVVEHTGASLDLLTAERGLGDLGRTAVLRSLLGESGSGPVSPAQVQRFWKEHMAAGKVTDAATATAFTAAPSEFHMPIAGWLKDLEERLQDVTDERLDVRFIGGLWWEAQG